MLIRRFSDSEEERLQLLAGIELNDKKLSELLRELRQLAGGSISENILHSIWLQRLPTRIQATLAVVEKTPLVKLAELADKIIDRDNGLQMATIASPVMSTSNLEDLEKRIAALEIKYKRGKSAFRSRSRSKYRTSSRGKNVNKNKEDNQVCFYHKKFGDKAKKCIIPCSMSKALTQKQEN